MHETVSGATSAFSHECNFPVSGCKCINSKYEFSIDNASTWKRGLWTLMTACLKHEWGDVLRLQGAATSSLPSHVGCLLKSTASSKEAAFPPICDNEGYTYTTNHALMWNRRQDYMEHRKSRTEGKRKKSHNPVYTSPNTRVIAFNWRTNYSWECYLIQQLGQRSREECWVLSTYLSTMHVKAIKCSI